MFQRNRPALVLFAMAAATPAVAQEDWLPTTPPDGLEMRIWLSGSEEATVELGIRFGDEPWCSISGRFSPEHHVSATGNVAAATGCGLDKPALARVLASGATVPVALKGAVTLESGAVVTVSETVDTDLRDVWDASIDVSADGVTFNAVKG